MDRARTDAGGAEAAPCPEEGCKGRTCTRSGDAAGISETTRQYLALKSPGRGRSPPSAAQAPTEPDHARNRAYLRNTSDDPGKGAGRGHIAPEARAHGPVTVPGVDPHLPEQRLDHRTMQRILQPHRCVVMLPAEQRAYQRELVAALERARGESVHELRAQAREAIERASEERRAQAQSASPRGLQQGGHSPRRRPLTAAHVGASSRARRTTKPRTDAPAGPAGSTKPRGSRKPGRARTRCGGGGVRLWNGRGVYVPVSLDASGPYRPGMMLDLRRFYAVAEPTREERESQFGVVYGEDGAPNEYRPHRRARPDTCAAAYFIPSEGCVSFEASPPSHSPARPASHATRLSVSLASIQERKISRAAEHAAAVGTALGIPAPSAEPVSPAMGHAFPLRPSRGGAALVDADAEPDAREESAGATGLRSRRHRGGSRRGTGVKNTGGAARHDVPPLWQSSAGSPARDDSNGASGDGPRGWTQTTLERRLREAPYVPDATTTELPPAVASERVRRELWGRPRPPASPPGAKTSARVRFQHQPSPPVTGADHRQASGHRPHTHRGAATLRMSTAHTRGTSAGGTGAATRPRPWTGAGSRRRLAEPADATATAGAPVHGVRSCMSDSRRSNVFKSAFHGERAMAWRQSRASAAPVLATPGLRGLAESPRYVPTPQTARPSTGTSGGRDDGCGASRRPNTHRDAPPGESHAQRAIGAGRAASARADRVVSRLRRDVFRTASQRQRPTEEAAETPHEVPTPPSATTPSTTLRSSRSRATISTQPRRASQCSVSVPQRPSTKDSADSDDEDEPHTDNEGWGEQGDGPVHSLNAVTSAHGYLGDLDVGKLEKETGYSRRELYGLFATFKSLCSLAQHKRGIDEATFRSAVPQLALEDDFFARRVFATLDKNRTGYIDWPAFAKVMAALDARDPRVQARFVFSVYDEDGDGRVTRRDLIEFLQHSMMLDKVGGDELMHVCEEAVDRVFKELQVPEGRSYIVREDVERYIDEDPAQRNIMQLLGRSIAVGGG